MRLDINIESVKKHISYNPDTGVFTARVGHGMRKIGDVLGRNNGKGYIVIQIFKKKFYAHRLAFGMVHGFIPEFIDHVNGDLTTMPSVLLTGPGCGWHGFITNGEVSII